MGSTGGACSGDCRLSGEFEGGVGEVRSGLAVTGGAEERVGKYNRVGGAEESAVRKVRLWGASDGRVVSAGGAEEGDRGEWGVAGGEDGSLE